VPLRWLLVDEFTMIAQSDTAVAACVDVDGLFVGAPAITGAGRPALSQARLIGCRPEQPLQGALDALARGAGAHRGALRHWPIAGQARPTSRPGPRTTWMA
jgi:hypothetical protein